MMGALCYTKNREFTMGLVKTEITLKNVADKVRANEGLISEQEIRRVTVEALVDTGAWTLVINEEVVGAHGDDIEYSILLAG